MNYLAHIYLSGENDALKIGNFIADSVKGKKYLEFPKGIQNGIMLHRKIDTFTDTHPVVRKSISRFSHDFGLYSGVITDILYDHFLAANWNDFHLQSLEKYVAEFYDLLEQNFAVLPKRVQNFYPYMVKQNWLVSYASISGIEKILTQMNHRVKTGVELQKSIPEIKEHYDSFEREFRLFFEELKTFTNMEKSKLDR
ncbi:MAG TPA: ACP phosphodiesterase [Flavobacteriaceae bacterium]|nr:ACP phosphodiesterase [Flavobacteriaceae bacterium]